MRVRYVAAVDVETTGLHATDRVISLAGWLVDTESLSGDQAKYSTLNLIFDPGKRSHPRAEDVHGYDDWTLRHQEPFERYKGDIADFLAQADIVLAHNASFDFGFITREFETAGIAWSPKRRYCTMQEYRRSGGYGRASLDAITADMGLRRVGRKHGALEDAWLALMIYYRLNAVDPQHIFSFAELQARYGLTGRASNFIDPPPMPNPLPPRRGGAGAIAKRVDRERMGAEIERLLQRVRPLARLLTHIGKASGEMGPAEYEVVTALATDAANAMSEPPGQDAILEAVAQIVERNAGKILLTQAAAAVLADEWARSIAPKWIAAIAAADGQMTAEERARIDEVKAAFGRAMRGSGESV